MEILKTEVIKTYFSHQNFNSNWSLKKIKEDLRPVLGEEPGIEVLYKKDVMINEINGQAKEIKKLVGFSITYTDFDEKIKTINWDLNIQ